MSQPIRPTHQSSVPSGSNFEERNQSITKLAFFRGSSVETTSPTFDRLVTWRSCRCRSRHWLGPEWATTMRSWGKSLSQPASALVECETASAASDERSDLAKKNWNCD